MTEATSRTPVSCATLTRQLEELGVRVGGVLLVHTSFRAVRPVEAGPEGLIRALGDAVGPQGTVVMPSWSDDDDVPFDPAASPVAQDLGVVARRFAGLPDVLRSDHPFAFAARGPDAARILRDPLPIPPHVPASPVGRVHDLDGQILLLGVNHDANTTIHLAELLAGAPYRRAKHCTVLRDGVPTRLDYGENDHCCERFTLVDEWMATSGDQRMGPVGHGEARLVTSRVVVGEVVAKLTDQPLRFLHGREDGCAQCDDARASVREADG